MECVLKVKFINAQRIPYLESLFGDNCLGILESMGYTYRDIILDTLYAQGHYRSQVVHDSEKVEFYDQFTQRAIHLKFYRDQEFLTIELDDPFTVSSIVEADSISLSRVDPRYLHQNETESSDYFKYLTYREDPLRYDFRDRRTQLLIKDISTELEFRKRYKLVQGR